MKILILLPVIIGASLNSYAKNLKDDLKYYQNPVANAGPDKTIYLTQTSTATLDGSASSGDTFQWTEISTDFMSGGIIASPTSKIANVTNLKQGTFYFKLAVSAGGTIKTDTMVVFVEYDVPPDKSILIKTFDMSDPSIHTPINDRSDTVSFFPTGGPKSSAGSDPNRFYLFRARLPGMTIDQQKGKLYTTNEDGYAGENAGGGSGNYPRSELQLCDACFKFDTTKTYVFEWKGYYPQNTNWMAIDNDPDWASTLAIFQVHGRIYDYAIANFEFRKDGNIYFSNEITGSKSELSDTYTKDAVLLGPIDSFYKKTHTLRVTMREGLAYPGQKAFIKVELDGVTKYFRNKGGVGSAYFDDYVKFGSIYDWRSWLTSDRSLTRGRKFSLVTESFRVYQLSEVNSPANIPPTANAGANKTITLPTNTISLTGSGTDNDGSIASYNWTKISGPASFKIVSATSATTDVTNLVQGTYVFELVVTDDKGAVGKSTVQITVNAAANVPPTANAGANKTITLPTNTTSLSGSGSDSDGTISYYNWTKISGPASFKIVSATSATTDVTNLVQGTYVFELAVTDNNGAVGKATVNVTVNAAANIPPTANAGTDKTITLPTTAASLSGSGSDSDGTIVSYNWTKISGPTSFKIVSATSATTDVTNLVQGTYVFELAVTDNSGAVGKATVNVTVNAAANIPPTANAGTDKTITLPANTASLSGSGSDSDGTIVSYSWTKISGPSAYNIVNPSSPVTDVSGLTQGVYQFELKVTDNNGAVGKATVNITVNAAANVPPTANAGTNKTITLPANTASLSGSGSDSDGTIVSYSWTKISGPSAYNIVNPSSPVTDVSGLTQGVYQFELKVTDNSGAVGKATVNVTVNAAANVPPTANAGTDKTITLPTNAASLSGSGSDSDGTIVSYNWTKISGPTSFKIVSATSATTNVTNLVQGTYQFELKVTDNKGALGKATVNVTVNAAANVPPTANAGTDKTITLPTSTASLSGSGSDSDGKIVSYNWTKVSGPAAFNIVNPSSPVTDVAGLVQGIYQFELTVTDNNGAIGKATMKITVNAPAETTVVTKNIPPMANAGNDTTVVSPVDYVTLKGRGLDADGSVVAYLWSQISGPSASTILANSLATTNVSNLVAGTYLFELTVTDNKGARGKDTVVITVALGRFGRETTLKVYPNPVHDITTLDINTGKPNTNLMIVITNMNGKNVYTKEFVAGSTNVKQQVNMSSLIKGIYIITVYFDGMKKQSVKVARM